MNGIDPQISVLAGDARTRLTFLAANSVHCVVTSPPYWKLRNYGISGQVGLEKTIEGYIAQIVEIFREVRRVLRQDGTCWINLGDKQHSKDLCGIPWRVALALQNDGWYLRCDVVWQKTNPMPESCKDRPTKSHEYIFLLTKSARYFYDHDAIKEPVTGNSHARGNGVNPKAKVPSGWDTNKGTSHHEHIGRYKRPGKNSRIHVDRDPAHIAKGPKSRQNESFSAAVVGLVATKNKRSVWTFATAPFRGAHFATFPAKLVEPCILAGTSTHGCCNHCGAPFKRITEKGQPDLEWQRKCGGDKNGEYHGTATKDFDAAKAQDASATKARILAGMAETKTIRWDATCKCENPSPVPCTVMDPFGGSGTTGMVAKQHGRNAILIELNPDYIPLIQKRCGIEKEAQVA